MSALVVLAVTVAVLLVAPAPALAQTDDVVDSWDVSYTVDSAGLLHVSETLVWRFGSSSGRHGIERQIPVREPWGNKEDKKDAVYEISGIAVSSPDASAEFTTGTECDGLRSCLKTITIGDPDERISADTAQYTIDYTVSGALRSSGDYDELYWDVVGAETPDVTALTVKAEVPGGAQDVSCFAGVAGSTDECTSRTITDGTATFTQSGKKKGAILTVGVKITSGLVADAQPHLTDTVQSSAAKELPHFLLTSGLGTVAVVVFLVLFSRRRRDERFADVPPGMVPVGEGRVRADTRGDRRTIPVRVIPPDVPVAVGSLLLDRGRRKVQKTSAVLVDLAVRGVIQLRAGNDWQQYGGVPSQRHSGTPWPGELFSAGAPVNRPQYYARLVRPELLTQPHERAFVSAIFGAGLWPGVEVALDDRGVLLRANDELDSGVAELTTRSGLMRGLGKISGKGGFVRSTASGVLPLCCFSAVACPVVLTLLLVLGGHHLGFALGSLPPLTILNAGLWVIVLRSHGQRTALGRALTDQVEGFREYLSTAEAEQIQFEEGQDIFSRYLPWAIAFGLTNRWIMICQRLIMLGRIPSTVPGWYYGDPAFFNNGFMVDSMVSSVEATSMPVSSSGIGTSSSSSFDSGGGFSGGGGGGGASSW